MRRVGTIAVAVVAVVSIAGAVTASALRDQPQDAQPVPDPIGDLLRQAPPAAAPVPPQETAPAADPAPAAPVPVTEPAAATVSPTPEVETVEAEPAPAARSEAVAPDRRQRRPIAVVEAVDKITAARMRFEVEVGGPPVRFNRQLLFTARACEVSAADEAVDDAVAFLEIAVEPRASSRVAETRQVFRGWMFASSPAVSGLQHPNYDAWVVGCKA